MKVTIMHFRGSRDRKKGNHIILQVEGIEKRDKAESLIGKTVTWTAPGKEKKVISGKIAAPHGNTGAVRAIFERGLPGQALGTEAAME